MDTGQEAEDRALGIFDALFRTLSKLGAKTEFDDSSERRGKRIQGAHTNFLGEKVMFRIRERYTQRPFDPERDRDEGHWTPKVIQERSGRLELELRVPPYRYEHKVWRDGKRGLVETKLADVIKYTAMYVQTCREGHARKKLEDEMSRLARARLEQRQEERRLEQRRVEILLESAVGSRVLPARNQVRSSRTTGGSGNEHPK